MNTNDMNPKIFDNLSVMLEKYCSVGVKKWFKMDYAYFFKKRVTRFHTKRTFVEWNWQK
jgi:hypothetical protein